jgi:hypothetical protein
MALLRAAVGAVHLVVSRHRQRRCRAWWSGSSLCRCQQVV